MAFCNWAALESVLTPFETTRWAAATNTEMSMASSSSVLSFSQPVFRCIKSQRERRKSQRIQSKRVFSFGGNDTIIQNDISDLKMLLQSKQVLEKEDTPISMIEPGPNAASSQEGTKEDKGSTRCDQRAQKTYNIVFVTAEVAPYSKVGGLSDVCGSLPVVLAARGHRVMVVSPRYINGVTDHKYAGAYDAQCRITIGCFSGQHEVAFFHEYRNGVDWVFVDHCCYHRPGNPYGDSRGAFGDNQFP